MIAVAAIAAHGLALRADFYMDDFLHIIGLPQVEESGVWAETWVRLIPNLLFHLTYQAFGYNHAAFHALNLLAHIGLCLVAFPALRDFCRLALGEKRAATAGRAAFWGALLLAVHPLCSEPVNYARCLMILLASLFSLLATWSALRAVRDRKIGWGIACLASIVLATLSKEPGLLHSVMGAAIAALCALPRGSFRRALTAVRARPKTLLGTVLVIAAAVPFMLHWIAFWIMRALGSLSHPLLGDHIMTQSRIFWAYIGKVISPTHLCVDHFVPWSFGWSDPWAVAGLAGIVALLVFCAGLFARGNRGVAAVLLLALAPLLIRFFYVIDEFMVEYRVYPAMPWFAALLGFAVAYLMERRERVVGILATGFAICLILLSAVRSSVWSNSVTLAADAVRQYPENNRARSFLLRDLILDEKHTEAVAMYRESVAAMARVREFNIEKPHGRAYSKVRVIGDYLVIEQQITKAIARFESYERALTHIERVMEFMVKNHPDFIADRHNQHPQHPWMVFSKTRNALLESINQTRRSEVSDPDQ
ncbi:MAG: hypothetical protein R3F11_13265 [Verrucomicrobiales bacterium]